MHYRRLGENRHQGQRDLSGRAWVTFGAQISAQNRDRIGQAAYDAGVNFFDNADIYAKGGVGRSSGSGGNKISPAKQ